MNNSIYLILVVAVLLVLTGCGSDTQVSQSETGTNGVERTETVAPKPVQPRAAKADPLLVPLFMEAALNGDAIKIGNALKAGTDCNVVDEENRTALMLAAFNGHTKVVSLLLDAGANVNLRESMNRTALMFASTGDNAGTVKLLLEHKADVNLIDGGEHWTALMFAAAEGQEEIVKLLLKHGANTKLMDSDGDTAQSFAAKNGHQAIAALLKAAADAEARKP